ncbi:MAG: hypothetical protein HZB34_07805 [Nitrospirae bacterium]|nr:hypothetical protein [Nitrospirota bacterium]
MVTISIQWQRLDTRRFTGGQIKRFRYDSPVAAAAAIQRFTSVSWCRLLSMREVKGARYETR